MRKVLCITLALTMVFASMTACAKKEEAAPETVAETAAEAEAETTAETTAETVEEPAGLANPMVEISDPAEFENQLDIHIDPNEITDEYKMFIIDGKLAHVVWTEKNVENEDVELVLRATKDPELGPECHGIYGEMSKPDVIEISLDDYDLELTFCTCGEYSIYTWQIDDTYYSLTYNKSMSGNAMSSVLDCVMFAIGAYRIPKDIVPVPYTVDVDNIEDGIYPVLVDDEGISNDNGKYFMDCDVYVKELFDVVDVHTMDSGDTITIEGDMVYNIKTVDNVDGEILINGGDESMGGITLVPNEGGTYVYRGVNDIASYQLQGSATLEIADNVVLTDTSDIENGCKEQIIKGAKEAAEYLASSEYARLTPSSGSIRTENGVIVEIKTWYTP